MSYEKLGFTSGQKLMADHLNHMEEGIANAVGASSWNNLSDKPFGEVYRNDTFIVDNSVFESADETDKFMWYTKVSDMTFTLDDFINGARFTDDSGNVMEYSYDEIAYYYNDSGYFYLSYVMVIPHDNFVFENHPDFTGMTVLKKGMYWSCAGSLTINGFSGFPNTTDVKKIDEKYLPGNFRVVLRDAGDARKVHDGTYKFEDTVVVFTLYGDVKILYPVRYDPEDNDMYTYATNPYYSDGKLCVYIQRYQGSGFNAGELSEDTVYLTAQN